MNIYNQKKVYLILAVLPFLPACGVDFKKIEAKAHAINNYEQVSLKLAKENRELKMEVKRLEYELQKYKHNVGGHDLAKATHDSHEAPVAHSDNHGNAGHENHEVKREVASVHAMPQEKAPVTNKDFVEYATYKWHADDMKRIADKEFKEKNYEKAAQFYTQLIEHYPNYKNLNDEYYFRAGVASFESGIHHDWTLSHFENLMKKHPNSPYFRSAKLWIALTHLKLGEKQKFFATVEEFRKRYRNTKEWKILSSYYEKIEEKTHE